MSIRMKALRPFGVRSANEGRIRRGREFTVANEQRADDLESDGLAYRIETKMQSPMQNKMEPPPQNKAAETGPFDLAGGKTGEAEPAPSSHPVRAPRRRRSSGSPEGLPS